MTLFERISNALATLGLPIYPRARTEIKNPYLVLRRNIIPDVFGDDTAIIEKLLCSLHFYYPYGFDGEQMIKDIKKHIEEAGFTRPSSFDISDDTAQCEVFEFEYAEVV